MIIKEIDIQETYAGTKRLYEHYEKAISRLPEGRLVCRRGKVTNTYYRLTNSNGKWRYHSLGNTRNDRNDALSQMKYKKYLSLAIPHLRDNVATLAKIKDQYREFDVLKTINSIDKNYRVDNEWEIAAEAERVMAGCNDNALEGLKQKYLDEEFVSAWLEDRKEKPEYYPEELRYATGQGFYVRSKSEMLIVTEANGVGLALKYEEPYEADGITYYPDFTILLPSGEVAIWEHFGLMDNETYRQKAIIKMMRYIKSGLLPGKTFFATYESESINFDVRDIRAVLSQMLRK